MGAIPKRPRPASLSGVESVEAATPTPSRVPRGKESAGGGGRCGGGGQLGQGRRWGAPCVGGLHQEGEVGVTGH